LQINDYTANSFQLPIWSLTQERVDKLKQQMVDKKAEHDKLENLSEKDLWCEDLDAFVKEWEVQLKEDADYEKTVRSTGRRASKKIGAGRNIKGRGKKDDDDFNPTKSKAAAKTAQPNPNKGIVKVEHKTHKGFLEMFQAKPKPKTTGDMGSDGAEEESGLSDDDFAALEAVKPSKQSSRAPSEQPANGRAKRAAAAAPKNWQEEEDESESDDGNFLGDVGAMVKGIGGGDADENNAGKGRLSLFAMSRSGTSGGERPTSSSGLPKLKTKPSRVFDLSDGDETNYEMLARSSPHKAAPAPKDNLDSFLSDEDDVVPITKKVPVKAAPAPVAKPIAKRGPKPKAAPAAQKPEPVEPKALSPAAKAYAAKQQAKMITSKENVFSDDEDSDIEMNDSPPPKAVARKPAAKPVAKPIKVVAQDIISDEEVEEPISKPKPTARPAKKSKKAISDDEDDEEPVSKPTKAKAKAPVRKAISDDEDEDDEPIAKPV
jgi:DNA topoisomerase-2